MTKGTVKIEITAINSGAIPKDIFMSKFMMLRTAKNVGDTETVNMYVLGKLRQAKLQGTIDFK